MYSPFRTSLCIEMVSTDLLSCFFTILYHLLDCKMVSDRFWMIYGIAENPRPTGKCVKYTPTAWGLRASWECHTTSSWSSWQGSDTQDLLPSCTLCGIARCMGSRLMFVTWRGGGSVPSSSFFVTKIQN